MILRSLDNGIMKNTEFDFQTSINSYIRGMCRNYSIYISVPV